MSPPDAGLGSKFHSFRQVQVFPDSTAVVKGSGSSRPSIQFLCCSPPKPQPSPVQLLTRPPAPLHLNRRGSIVLVTAKKKPAHLASLGLATSNGGRGEGDLFPSLDIIDIDRGAQISARNPFKFGARTRTDSTGERIANAIMPPLPFPAPSVLPFLSFLHFIFIQSI